MNEKYVNGNPTTARRSPSPCTGEAKKERDSEKA